MIIQFIRIALIIILSIFGLYNYNKHREIRNVHVFIIIGLIILIFFIKSYNGITEVKSSDNKEVWISHYDGTYTEKHITDKETIDKIINLFDNKTYLVFPQLVNRTTNTEYIFLQIISWEDNAAISIDKYGWIRNGKNKYMPIDFKSNLYDNLLKLYNDSPAEYLIKRESISNK